MSDKERKSKKSNKKKGTLLSPSFITYPTNPLIHLLDKISQKEREREIGNQPQNEPPAPQPILYHPTVH